MFILYDSKFDITRPAYFPKQAPEPYAEPGTPVLSAVEIIFAITLVIIRTFLISSAISQTEDSRFVCIIYRDSMRQE